MREAEKNSDKEEPDGELSEEEKVAIVTRLCKEDRPISYHCECLYSVFAFWLWRPFSSHSNRSIKRPL